MYWLDELVRTPGQWGDCGGFSAEECHDGDGALV